MSQVLLRSSGVRRVAAASTAVGRYQGTWAAASASAAQGKAAEAHNCRSDCRSFSFLSRGAREGRQRWLHRATTASARSLSCSTTSYRTNSGGGSGKRSRGSHNRGSSGSSGWRNWLGVGAATAAAAAVGVAAEKDQVEACGIVGVVGTSSDAHFYLLEGLSILRNRGYDSAGLATVDEDSKVLVTKYASKDTSDSFSFLKQNSGQHANHSIGIAHTRWATHGGKTDKNAHPHMDYGNRIALVHNGTINNAAELREALEAKGIEFRSETDSEVIAHLIGQELDMAEATGGNITLKDATARALERCDGTWGIAVLQKGSKEGRIVLACNGSPMVIGISQNHTFVASETSAFSRHTKNFIAMKDGEIGVISDKGHSLDISRIEVAPDQKIETDPAPWPHWTIKETMQQPEAIARSLAFGGRLSDGRVILGGPDRHRDKLLPMKHLVLAACGTSLYAAQYGAKLMREMGSMETVQAMDAAEMRASDLPVRNGGMLVVSQSGETRDVLKALKHAEMHGVTRMSVVNAVGSAVARSTQLGVYLNAGRETGVASTKAFTTQVTVLALLALWFRQIKNDVEDDYDVLLPDSTAVFEALQRLPISFGMAMGVRPQCKALAARLVNKKHCFVLGKGYAEPVALEGALKLKEMAYIHAEGYSGGALKHGPFALIQGAEGPDAGGATPIIMIILDDEHSPQMLTAAAEVKARGADIMIITDNPALAKGLDDNPVVIPPNGPLTALIAVLPLQLIAYEMALLKGHNPDTPRNLAKAVTTD